MSSRTSATCGLVLLVLGVLLLVGSLGIVQVDVWRYVIPGLLIALGIFTIWMVLTRPEEPALVDLAVPAGQVAGARILFRFGAGQLRVAGGAAEANLLELAARGGARHSLTVSGDQADLSIWVPPEFLGDILAPWRWGGNPPRWEARLRKDLPLRLDFETGACEADIDLTDLTVPELRLATGASSVVLRVPAAGGETRARIAAGAASVKVRVPPGVAARVISDVPLGEVKVDPARFLRSGAGYESPDYAAARHRIELRVEIGAASLEVG